VFLALGAWMQFHRLRDVFGSTSFWPAFHADEARLLLRPGVFVWLQSVGAVVFGQLDRIFLGLSLGALVVAPYALCVQFAQPILGLTASALHFLFPYLSRHANAVSASVLQRTLWKAFLCNAAIVVCVAVPLLLFGDRLIQLWAGAAVAKQASWMLPLIVIGSALMGLSVTGTYALQAFGLFRTVAIVSLSGRAAMLLLMLYMLRHLGLHGLVQARLCYGAVSLLVYLPLLRRLCISTRALHHPSPAAIVCELHRGSELPGGSNV
jgi:O-antigen/teichoic acid export membrane protein